jgi:hypothetical protein
MWKLKIVPFTVVIVGAHPKPASAAHGKCHFLPTKQESVFLLQDSARIDLRLSFGLYLRIQGQIAGESARCSVRGGI